MVACRQQEAGAAELGRGADQRHQAVVRLGDAMAREGDPRRIAGNPPAMFDHRRGLLIDGVAQFAGAIEAMDLAAQPVARGLVGGGRRSNLMARQFPPERLSLKDRNRLAGAEAELGIEAERSIVEAGLKQAYARGLPARGTVQDVLHQPAADTPVLPRRIDGDGPDTDDVRTLVEEVAAGNAAIDLGNDRIEARMSEQHRHEVACHFRRRKVGREVVGRADRSEGLEADGAAGLCIGRRSRTKNDAHGTSSCR